MRISQLDSHRVALWGWGREGRAAYHAIRQRLPALPLTLFCNAEEAAETVALQDALLKAETRVDGTTLSAFDVVVKSPGISPYRHEALEAAAKGTRFIGGTALWFGEHGDAAGYAPGTFCVTGTKGKSTTTSLLAHLLRAGGFRTALAGNIGLPLLEVLEPQPAPDYWAIELSSYQTRDVAISGVHPDVAVVLNVFPEHLDWHGGEARYIEDKLALVTGARPRVAALNAADPHLARLVLPDSEVRWFNREDGWHLRGDDLYRAERFVLDTTTVPLPGRHNRSNLCAVLTAIEAVGIEAAPLAMSAQSFRPLPNRLQTVGERDGIVYVNDSISTTPHASLAALDCFRSHRVAILLGGHDRGLDWEDFAARMREQPPAVIVTMGANGARIHALLEPLVQVGGFQLAAANGLVEAMAQARRLLEGRGVILLSPGAPSFGQYKDYVARGRHFAEIAGFDPDTISSIPGLGIA
ncbi:UDP-N-acetylmuramoyl-L-alanine--D-glutamate ligase [Pseudoxanthomonas sp. UTMC 1351]|uniref:UDP-N-acetylmuramoyl-L-alanine--D-glutamate ligase n=1 Tax=Pseudoxanthomonas sp. UTMC 1351 TaxID=2695853 RepID=UPI0034CFAAE5